MGLTRKSVQEGGEKKVDNDKFASARKCKVARDKMVEIVNVAELVASSKEVNDERRSLTAASGTAMRNKIRGPGPNLEEMAEAAGRQSWERQRPRAESVVW